MVLIKATLACVHTAIKCLELRTINNATKKQKKARLQFQNRDDDRSKRIPFTATEKVQCLWFSKFDNFRVTEINLHGNIDCSYRKSSYDYELKDDKGSIFY